MTTNLFLQICIGCCLQCFVYTANAQTYTLPENTTLYVVRHAEKDTGINPVLSAAGRQRAGDLYRLLKNENIAKIYTTDYPRTKMTADSLRIYAHVEMLLYRADTTGEGLITRMKEVNERSKAILIIGHSNTVPAILRKISGPGVMISTIPDSDFDNIYVIHRNNGSTIMRAKKYGRKLIPARP